MSAEALRIERAMRMVRDRHRLMVEVLESEREQGMPVAFDWRAWRLNRALLMSRLHKRVDDDERLDQLFERIIHSQTTGPVDMLNGSQ